ncbi:MAG: DUF7482 domain-containing protein [Gemmatimonadaceae bacterium]
MKKNIIVVLIVAVLMAGFVVVARAKTGTISPPVTGFLNGQEIRFVHTEASNQKIADTLTAMTHSPVLVVPSLAQMPASMLANVYAFSNGLKGTGPLGGQPDVFDNPPGTPGYTPLRALNVIAWKPGVSARELRSAAEVLTAEQKGELTITKPGVVINMPLITWPGGRR